MITYESNEGILMSYDYLNALKYDGKSEEEIAFMFGISRQMLNRIRRRMGWKVPYRSDRGKYRVDPSERLERKKLYMREYQRRNK